MTHIVPILCILLFIGFVEYRLQKHLNQIDIKIRILSDELTDIRSHNKILNKIVISLSNKIDNESNSTK